MAQTISITLYFVSQLIIVVHGFSSHYWTLQRRSPIGFAPPRFSPISSHQHVVCPTMLDDSTTRRLDVSLAGPYVLQYESSDETVAFGISRIQNWRIQDPRHSFPTDASFTWALLHNTREPTLHDPKAISKLRATINVSESTIVCDMSADNDANMEIEPDLVDVLSRVLVQSLANTISQQRDINLSAVFDIVLPSGSKSRIDFSKSKPIYEQLFPDREDDDEMVALVDASGQSSWGYVPRSLVHRHNLLHRGVGILVSSSSTNEDSKFEDSMIYCHQRTASKRIFPSLYDMFVGGVAVAGEHGDASVTAQRELGEELGLSPQHQRALTYLYNCIVCTDYNRCVVDVFRCDVENKDECKITWQPEEVAWGAWVPYSVVEAAADRSIQRCSAWPGKYPKVQSKRKGNIDEDGGLGFDGWEDWDFVPDGLLVWEAWLECT